VDVRGGPDRIERAQVALHHCADGARAGRLGARDARDGREGRCGKASLNETAAAPAHAQSLPRSRRLTHHRGRPTRARGGPEPQPRVECAGLDFASPVLISNHLDTQPLSNGGHTTGGLHLMTAPRIKTTVVGSYPFPDWLGALPSEQAVIDAT